MQNINVKLCNFPRGRLQISFKILTECKQINSDISPGNIRENKVF